VKKPWRRLRLAACLTAVAAIVWFLASWAVAYRMTRRAQPQFPEPPPTVSWGRLEPLQLTTRDGERLGAWYLEGQPARPNVVLLHGNGASRSACLDRAEVLAAEGCAVLLVTLRAHGDSTGEVNDFGYSARHDVIAAVTYLEQHHPGRPI